LRTFSKAARVCQALNTANKAAKSPTFESYFKAFHLFETNVTQSWSIKVFDLLSKVFSLTLMALFLARRHKNNFPTLLR
jgi:hypothetical protein